MAEEIRNISDNETSEEKNFTFSYSPDCIPWLVASITECLAIVILNLLTIIVFVRQRQLQRQSTYLIIHLAIVDLLVGAVSGPVIVNHLLEHYCDLWRGTQTIFRLADLFPMASLVNLAAISLERMHATLFPFEHRVIKKKVYAMAIAAIWFLTSSRETALIVLYETRGNSHLAISFKRVSLVSILSVSLILISISSISIFIKVRFSPNPQHHGETNRERKLTATLLFVTLASLVTWLPYNIIFIVLYRHEGASGLKGAYFHDVMWPVTLAGANSIVNPIVYAIWMPEFRKGVIRMFRRPQHRTRVADLPLVNLQHTPSPTARRSDRHVNTQT